MCHKLFFCMFTDESYKQEDDSLPNMNTLSIEQASDQNFQIAGTYFV